MFHIQGRAIAVDLELPWFRRPWPFVFTMWTLIHNVNIPSGSTWLWGWLNFAFLPSHYPSHHQVLILLLLLDCILLECMVLSSLGVGIPFLLLHMVIVMIIIINCHCVCQMLWSGVLGWGRGDSRPKVSMACLTYLSIDFSRHSTSVYW